MCTWGELGRDCVPGDVRFMVIEFSVSPDTGFYVQMLTEPDDVVLAEAVSPARHAELQGRIGPAQRREDAGDDGRLGMKGAFIIASPARGGRHPAPSRACRP